MATSGTIVDRALRVLFGDPTAALGAATKQYADKAAPLGYIDGLQLLWTSGTAISVTSGSAYIPSLGYALHFASPLSLTGLTLTASTFYHLYGYSNAGTPAIELVTTAPAAAYDGTARAKTGDTSRRYLGSVKTDASGNMYRFIHNWFIGKMAYLPSVAAGGAFRLLSNGVATTTTTVSCSSSVPITCFSIFARVVNTFAANGPIVWVGNPDAYPTLSTPICAFTLGATVDCFNDIPLSTAQAFNYAYSSGAGTTGFYVDLQYYNFLR